MIEEIIQGLQKKAEDRLSTPLRLSNSGKCLKALAFSFFGYPAKPYKIDSLFDFMFGNAIHDYLTKIMKAEGLLCNDQKQVALVIDNIAIFGHIDGETLDGKQLIEIKSQKEFGFKKVDNGEISKHYLWQAQAYMKAGGYESCKFVFFNKSYFLKYKWQKSGNLNDFIKIKIVDRDDKLIELIENKWRILLTADINDIKPDLQEDDYWQCEYCQYDDICSYRYKP
jgi:hypothetical protein